jgi:hypothetical protein
MVFKRIQFASLIAASTLVVLPLVGFNNVGRADDTLPEKVSFDAHVKSILSENCFFCHGPDANQRQADLRLDTAEGAESAIEAGLPDDSDLIARVFSDDPDALMPPPDSGRSLSDKEKEILRRWIEQGAEYETHWAFKRIERPAVPKVNDNSWPRNPVDQFVLAKLESKEILPSPRAQPQVLVRRLYLDLIGLPPSPADVDRFTKAYDSDANAAIDALVDKLFASEHYGERMALAWLDAARYADSNGFQQDGDRTQWPWRDWVVDAMNSNMPFDQFTVEQLAGDLLPEPTQEQLIATAFNRNHMLNGEGGAIAEEQRNNYVFDRVDTTATTWLGLTMACAQCHDHKYDPITHRDYYQFFAYFNSVDENGGVNVRNGRVQVANPFIEMPNEEQIRQIEAINAELAPINKSLADADKEIDKALEAWVEENRENPPSMGRDIFNAVKKNADERNGYEKRVLKDWFLLNVARDEWKKLKQKQKEIAGKLTKVKSKVVSVMIMRDKKKPRKTHVFDRGVYDQKKENVSANVPHFLPPLPENAKADRLALANWLVDRGNPLTSRVIVNRYWQSFFGTGIVKTAEDFGVQSELPSHPDLLDWLAVEFMKDWNVKRIHRLLVTSETYLQSSKFRQDLIDVDPENRLLARSPRYRLPSSLIRDAALSASGLLDPLTGGPPVYPYQPKGLWKEFSLEKFAYTPSTGKSLHRRSLYTFWRRTVPPPNMFDSANRQTCMVKLSRTNTPLQALVLLNDPTYVEAAFNLASKVLNELEGKDDHKLVAAVFVRALGREPTQSELGSLLSALGDSREFYSSHAAEAIAYLESGNVDSVTDQDQRAALASLASLVQIVLNTDEFMTRE